MYDGEDILLSVILTAVVCGVLFGGVGSCIWDANTVSHDYHEAVVQGKEKKHKREIETLRVRASECGFGSYYIKGTESGSEIAFRWNDPRMEEPDKVVPYDAKVLAEAVAELLEAKNER